MCSVDTLVLTVAAIKQLLEVCILPRGTSVQGIRTVVVTNYTATAVSPYPAAENELWTSYPDANPARSFYPGDDRAALAPFLAFRTLGDSFKWLFYGDDDTVFFADAALALASTLDSELPYFVTDNLWWSELFGGAWHPHPQASSSNFPFKLLYVTLIQSMELLENCIFLTS